MGIGLSPLLAAWPLQRLSRKEGEGALGEERRLKQAGGRWGAGMEASTMASSTSSCPLREAQGPWGRPQVRIGFRVQMSVGGGARRGSELATGEGDHCTLESQRADACCS